MSAAGAWDLVAIGRTGIDLYPLQHGVGLEHVQTFGKFLGGSATNVAVAAARHGRSCALITRTGTDPFGRFVRSEVERLGVSSEFIDAVPGPPTPITFCEVKPPEDFPLYFYRYPSAPDLQITPISLPLDQIRQARVFWATATGLCQEPSRSAHHAAWAARGRTGLSILDLDYRPMFWDDPAQARAAITHALDQVTVAVGNQQECELATGESDPHRAASALLEHGLEVAVVKGGAQGVLAMTRTETVHVPPFAVRVVNGLGAGDAFGGALVHGALAGWPWQRTLEFANVAGALVAGRLECSTAMPTTAEVEDGLTQWQQAAALSAADPR